MVFAVALSLGASLRPTLLRAMTYMIVASPCAVVLATMPPLLSAIANAGRHGVLVKSAVVMEQLGQTTQVAFDKTGTLTQGTPHLTAIQVLVDLRENEVLRLAASAERPSEHPLGRAVVTAATRQGLALADAVDFSATAGRGVHAVVDGQHIRVGSPALLTDPTTAQIAAIAAVEKAGQTAVVVLVDDRPVGVLTLADQLRPTAAATVAALTDLTGSTPVLLTGVNALAASSLAVQVGITDVHAALLPQDKAERIQALRNAGGHVLVVGDGINDVPALATANLGVAMGRHGSDLTLQTADAVLVRDDLPPSQLSCACPAQPDALSFRTSSSPPSRSSGWSHGTSSAPCRYPWGSSATKAGPSSSASTDYGCSATAPGSHRSRAGQMRCVKPG